MSPMRDNHSANEEDACSQGEEGMPARSNYAQAGYSKADEPDARNCRAAKEDAYILVETQRCRKKKPVDTVLVQEMVTTNLMRKQFRGEFC